MNKYFLPVYHSELKPWIKWWILKRLNGGESSLKAITISSGTLRKVDKSKALSIKEYYGNAIQNGTPTPESPVEIQTISGDNTFTINGEDYNLDLKSKNRFYIEPQTKNGVTLSYDNGAIVLNGTSNSNFIAFQQDVELNGTYTLSVSNDTIQSNTFIRTRNSNGTLLHTITLNNTDLKTSTMTSEIAKLEITIGASGITYNNFKIYVQLNEGTTALPYESYYNYELCKIGDYKDKIVNDNGTWKIDKNIGKVIYNGTENWYFTSNCCYINNIVDTVKRPANNNTKANILCDHYQIDTLANCYNNVTDKRISVNNGGYVYIYDTSFTSANDIKTWLTTHNTELYYQLATASTETITNTNLISQLNALYKFHVNSSTVSISNNSEIQFEVLLEYYGR